MTAPDANDSTLTPRDPTATVAATPPPPAATPPTDLQLALAAAAPSLNPHRRRRLERLLAPPTAPLSRTAAPRPAARSDPAGHAALAAAGALAAHAAGQTLFLVSWFALDHAFPGPAAVPAWIAAWLLLLLTMTPCHALELRCRLAASQLGGRALHARLLTRLLLPPASPLPPDFPVTSAAAGPSALDLFGRILDLEAVETHGLPGLQSLLLALVDLAAAVAILLVGTAGRRGIPSLALLVAIAAVLALLAALAWRHLRAHRRWRTGRQALTTDHLERLLGHRTHLAQTAAPEPSAGDPAATPALLHTLALARTADRRAQALHLLPRTALLLGLLGVTLLIPAAPLASPLPAIHWTAALGGLLLAAAALGRLAGSLVDLAEATTAYEGIKPLLTGAADSRPGEPERFADVAEAATGAPWPSATGAPLPPAIGTPLPAAIRTNSAPATPTFPPSPFLLEAHHLAWGPPDPTAPRRSSVSLTLGPHDHILLTGPPGAGKSTLAAILAGEITSHRGILLLSGLDRSVLGSRAWRRHVALATPNDHLFAATLAWNLLLARPGPHTAADCRDAATLCRALGLGALLDRMPQGIDQLVGDGGWQLSQGERSRVLAARALHSKSALVILDALLEGLDHDSVRQLLAVASRYPGAVLVLAPAR
jgi:ATP-binding cassette subfamily B protein